MIKTIFEKVNVKSAIDDYIIIRDEKSAVISTAKKEIKRLEKIKAFYTAKVKEEGEKSVSYVSLIETNGAIEQIKNKLNVDLEKLNKEQEVAIDTFYSKGSENMADDLYNAYLSIIYNEGRRCTRFSYVTANGKEKEIEFKVYKNSKPKDIFKGFLLSIGFRGLNKAGDIDIMVDYFRSIIGAKVCKKGERFITHISIKQFKEIILNGIIDYAIRGGFYMYSEGEGLIS